MPYRNESRLTTAPKRIFCRIGSTYIYDYEIAVKTLSAAQYGWRSAGEAEAARVAAAQVQSGARWADTLNVAAALDRIERSTSNPIVRAGMRPVHERRYSEQDWNDGYARFSNPDAKWVSTYGLDFGLNFDPYPTSDAYIRSKGAEMLRASRPTAPHASLGQWIGELRDFHSLFRSANLVGGNANVLKAGGAGWLGYQFGWAPFIGDLLKAAQVILNSSTHIDQFLRDSGRLVHRKQRQVLNQATYTVPGTITVPPNIVPQGQNEAGYTFSTPYGDLKTRYRVGIGNSDFRAAFSKINVTNTTEIRSFAMFEYFAFDPDGFLEKLGWYEQQARYLLGLTLTPDLLWELTPWSWILDWFADIGGFLSYQVSVENDSLVMRQSGAVVDSLTTFQAKVYTYYHPDVNTPLPGYDQPFYNISTSLRKQTRLASGPYNMGTTWDLSNRQWYIVGALGLTIAPGRQPLT
jgi:hypothetical protein